MNSEDLFIRNRLIELANQSYQRDLMTHSDFMGLHEQSILDSIRNELPPVCCQLMGGYRLCERKIVLFLPYEDYPYETPFSVLRIKTVGKQQYEELSHRDYLGAIMGLGLKREQMGDLVAGEDGYYIMALPTAARVISEQLSLVRHTAVRVETIPFELFQYEPKRSRIQATVASVRLDSVIASAYNLSRNHIIRYIEDGKVSVNGRLITTNAYGIHEADIISVRGLGKIQFLQASGNTRKGRIVIEIDKFVG